MSNVLLYLSWNVSPSLYDGFVDIRYYSLFFALSFLIGYQLVKKMYINESGDVLWMDKLLVYTVVGTIIGARLGHVFFYDWDYYSKNLIEIPMVWKGGLASHGAAIALVVAMWLYSKKVTKKSTLWSLDKLVIAVALAAGFIRVGNLMNSEIVGQRTTDKSGIFYQNKSANLIGGFFSLGEDKISFIESEKDTTIENITYPLAFVKIPLGTSAMNPAYASAFANRFSLQNIDADADFFSGDFSKNYRLSTTNELIMPIYIIPRIPTQLWEAFSYWLIFSLLFWGYWRKNWYLFEGRLFGIFFTLLFASRFIIEFFKEHQTLTNSSSLNMGQYLSIPMVIIGIYFIIKSKAVDKN